MASLIPATQQLAAEQIAAWNLGSDRAPLFLGLMAVVFVFGLLMWIRSLARWRDD